MTSCSVHELGDCHDNLIRKSKKTSSVVAYWHVWLLSEVAVRLNDWEPRSIDIMIYIREGIKINDQDVSVVAETTHYHSFSKQSCPYFWITKWKSQRLLSCPTRSRPHQANMPLYLSMVSFRKSKSIRFIFLMFWRLSCRCDCTDIWYYTNVRRGGQLLLN